ncbi:MAG TPA: tetratricopeptide repeat protein [Candidatus Methylomirabilis sp.]|nr:tetratricopeptide repeat protein [Candidatus Methylomirabilis sp.]
MPFDTSNPLAGLGLGTRRSFDLPGLLGKVIDWCVVGLAVLLPLWFMPLTLDILELNKQTLLVILTMAAVIAWVGKALLERSFSLTRSWLHLVVVFFLGGYLVTSLFSLDRYLSFVGNFGQMQWAFATIAAFALMYLVIVNRYRTAGQVYDLVLWFLLGSTIAGLYGLFQMGGVYLLKGWAVTAAKTFNSVGTVNALGVYLVVPTVIAASLTVLGCKERTCVLARGNWQSQFWQGVIWVSLVTGLLTAVVVDYWVVWAGILFGTALLVAIPFLRTRKFGHPVTLAIPTVIGLISVLLLLFRTPVNFQLPSEVAPSARHSWQIAQQVLRDAPLFGSGPGTWIYDYAKYRSVGVNLSQFWNIRFERGLSAFLTMLATLGLVGTTLWILLVVSGIVKSATHLVREKSDDAWQAYLTIFVGWLTVVFLAFLYNYNLAHHFTFWFLLGLLGILVSQGEWSWDARTKSWISSVLSVFFIIFAVGAISVTWLAGQRLVADAEYSQAVKSFQRGDDIQTSIERLNTAISLNKLNDVFNRNLSQAYLIKAGRLLSAGTPDRETGLKVNGFVAQAVENAKRAADISPSNVDNWANLASVYQAIASFTRGADEFAIANYREALAREPNNPAFMNEVGKLFVLRSDAYRTLLQSPDEKARKDAEENVKAELEKAAEGFNQSITAKPDYAPAHFNLGVVYERQGRLRDAVTKLEQVLSANPQDVGVAFQLATLYYRVGDKDSSRKLFEQIVQAVPNYANARWFLSVIYEEQGLYDLAVAEVEKVQATNPGVDVVDQRLEALKKARDAKAKPATKPLPEPVKEEITGPAENNPVKAQ